MRQSVETAKAQLLQAQQNLTRQQDLWKQQLTTREALEKAVNDVKVAESNVSEREKNITPQESRINVEKATLESARYDLSKVRMESPIDGIVTRRNVQEGETAVIGTMNNAGTVLLELADMGVIQAEVEVDETNVPHVQIGQPAKITIDAIPERTFKGHVSEIGNSPIQAAGARRRRHPGDQFQGLGDPRRAGARRAPRLHLHRRHHDRHAQGRRLGADSGGRRPRADLRRQRPGREGAQDRQEAPRGADTARRRVGRGAQSGQTRKETEGVFAVRDGKSEFIPIKMGDRRRQVFRGAVGPQGRRSGDHRPV
jgi:HlyD family secretion protein